MNLRSIFSFYRWNEKTHLGLGDIRLTVAEQDEIVRMHESTQDDNDKLREWIKKAHNASLDDDGRWLDGNGDYLDVLQPNVKAQPLPPTKESA